MAFHLLAVLLSGVGVGLTVAADDAGSELSVPWQAAAMTIAVKTIAAKQPQNCNCCGRCAGDCPPPLPCDPCSCGAVDPDWADEINASWASRSTQQGTDAADSAASDRCCGVCWDGKYSGCDCSCQGSGFGCCFPAATRPPVVTDDRAGAGVALLTLI